MPIANSFPLDHLMDFLFSNQPIQVNINFSVCGGLVAQESLQNYLSHQMDPPTFLEFSAVKANFQFQCKGPCDGLCITLKYILIPLNHPNGGHGFKIIENNHAFVFLTDNELGFTHLMAPYEDLCAFCQGADLLIHDAQYTNKEYTLTKGWGHSTFEAATKLAIDAEVKRFGIFHHDFGIARTMILRLSMLFVWIRLTGTRHL